MNDEIKEILNIINYKYKDYYVQDIVSGDDLKLLSDYITNLQQRCEKATELIEKSRVKATPFFKQFDGDLLMPKREVDKLLNILNWGDKYEENKKRN